MAAKSDILDSDHALALIDRFAFELLVLAYEFDYYFPALLESAELQQTLEVTLPARVAAARVGLADGTAGAPLEAFVEEQLQRARWTLEGAIDISEASEAFVLAGDALYHWLRRYDCIGAERVTVGAVVRRDRKMLLALVTESGCWGLPTGPQQPGESLDLAVLRTTEEEAGLVLDEDCIRGVIAQSYDYDEVSDGLYWTMYMLLDCPDGREPYPRSPDRCSQVCFVSWEQLPEPDDQFSPQAGLPLGSLSDSLSGLVGTGFDLNAYE